jgi:uncharacterized membrane protein YphA (DoxX/SURF4 family)
VESAVAADRPLDTNAPARQGGRGLAFVGWIGGALLGAILLIAAWAKLIHPVAFAEQIGLEGLSFGLSPMLVALAAIALEIALGAALLFNLRSRPVLLVATALVLFFLFLTGRTYWRAEHGIAPPAGGCGCFGNLVERTPGEAFWQDLAMLVPTLALAWLGRPKSEGRRFVAPRWAAVAILTLGGTALAWAAPKLPLDDLATRLKPGTKLADLCAGAGEARVCLVDLLPELARGRHWVVLADPLADDFGPIAERLNHYTLSGSQPPVMVLADLTAEQQNAVFWRHAPAFDLHETPAALLRPLYRTMPRSFLVEEGRVVRTERGVARELGENRTPAS